MLPRIVQSLKEAEAVQVRPFRAGRGPDSGNTKFVTAMRWRLLLGLLLLALGSLGMAVWFYLHPGKPKISLVLLSTNQVDGTRQITFRLANQEPRLAASLNWECIEVNSETGWQRLPDNSRGPFVALAAGEAHVFSMPEPAVTVPWRLRLSYWVYPVTLSRLEKIIKQARAKLHIRESHQLRGFITSSDIRPVSVAHVRPTSVHSRDTSRTNE